MCVCVYVGVDYGTCVKRGGSGRHALSIDAAHVPSLFNLGLLHQICHKSASHAGLPLTLRVVHLGRSTYHAIGGRED